MKLEQKFEAIRLRKEGLAYSLIRQRVPVSKSTLSLWLRDVELTQEQKQKILIGLEKSRFIVGEKKKADRRRRTELVKQEAEKEFIVLSKNPFFFVGLSLYAAEGDKSQERVKFANSDPNLIMLMMKWFREICNISEDRFRIALHTHDLLCNEDVISYWVDITKVPKTQFHKLYVKKSSLRQRRNILYNGTCSIVINSKDLFRKIHFWKQALFEKYGICSRSSMDRTEGF